MPEPVDVAALLDLARTNMDAAAILLMVGDAQSLDESRALLHKAVTALTALDENGIHQGFLGRVTRLQEKGRSLDRLLREANNFHAGAFQSIERLNGAYTSHGEMMASLPIRMISVVL
ncbi:MAG: hypothetical protein M3Z36_12995 [Acidobacteriota bacterium]|nr:hypothetical protein [Acidobacteriota bacterium]